MKRTFVFHPFLFALYSILGVYSRNATDIPIQWVFRPIAFIAAFALLSFIIANVVTKDLQRAGLISTLSIFWLFSGHINRILLEIPVFRNAPVTIFLFVILWTIALIFIGSYWTWNQIRNHKLITIFLNATSIFLIILPAWITISNVIQTIYQNKFINSYLQDNKLTTLKGPETPPDIYLIIVDAYGRSDYLQKQYSYNNDYFTDFLLSKGFYVADQSETNYPQTQLSLASLTNMQYLEFLSDEMGNTDNRAPLTTLLHKSRIRTALEQEGYKFVALPSAAIAFSQIRDADVYIQMTKFDVNEFEGLLLSTSIFNFIIDEYNLDIPIPSYDLHRRYILYTLDKLKTIPNTISGPKYVFAHIMAPHPPFVLDKDGNPIQPDRQYNSGDASGFKGTHEEYINGYVNEVEYLNKLLAETITEILINSERPPIIIIQGDHGPGNYFNLTELDNNCLWERYSILNAYYFPDGNYSSLYPSITPVNSFRVVLNTYFDANLELLDDLNYFSGWKTPYIFTDISENIQATCTIK